MFPDRDGGQACFTALAGCTRKAVWEGHKLRCGRLLRSRDRGSGTRLPKPLLPPELIIQDELHRSVDRSAPWWGCMKRRKALCTREVGDKLVLPKIVASTAVRRAEAQVRALFGRSQVDVFPPPGPDRRDTFFADREPD